MNNAAPSAKPAAFGPYSSIRVAGNFAFVSGQIGVNPATGQLDMDVARQTEQALQNMAAILASAGLHSEDVVDVTIFLADMGDFTAVNAVYGEFFTTPYPARACLAVSELPRVGKGAPVKVEIKATALRQSS